MRKGEKHEGEYRESHHRNHLRPLRACLAPRAELDRRRKALRLQMHSHDEGSSRYPDVNGQVKSARGIWRQLALRETLEALLTWGIAVSASVVGWCLLNWLLSWLR